MKKAEAITRKFVMDMEIGRVFTVKDAAHEMNDKFGAAYSQTIWSDTLAYMREEGTITRQGFKYYQRTEPKQRPTPVAKNLQLADVSDLDLLLELRRRDL